MIIRRLLIVPLFIILAALSSCSRAEPQIHHGYMELVYYPGKSRPVERYSFFILPEDDDGIENLSELYLYHDMEGLRWLFTPKDWIEHEENGKTWIGSRSIAMFDDGQLPRGQYRAVLVNKGGESTERKFTFDGPETPPYPFPTLSVNGDTYKIDSKYPVNNIIGYDPQGRILQINSVTEKEGSTRNLRLSANVRTIALWAEEPQYRTSVLTEEVLVR